MIGAGRRVKLSASNSAPPHLRQIDRARIAERHRETGMHRHLGLLTMRLRDALGQLRDRLAQRRGWRGERAHRALHMRAVGDDIVSGPRLDLRNGDHHRIMRVELARHHGLDRGDDLAGDGIGSAA
jgi:hypothetical protein